MGRHYTSAHKYPPVKKLNTHQSKKLNTHTNQKKTINKQFNTLKSRQDTQTANNMTRNKIILNNTTFENLIKEDYWIHCIAQPVTCLDQYGKFEYYRSCSYPIEYIVTPEQIERAKTEYNRRRREELESLQPGILAFVPMGMDFDVKLDNSPNNHRIRCNFYNSKGHKYLIELTATMDKKQYSVNFSVDVDLEEQRKGTFIQDYYGACGLTCNVKIPATWPAILQLVNRAYKCNYTTGKLFKYFINPDEYTNTSK